ncbi:competence type IV pilus minor pilin ComGF [Halalkalibacter okhensis]|uniref:Competence protein ComG n=1 Tax=Halalkalibacter okhensis TaxID=333138 RepID=A0A0B0I6H7_9BACI|nr:competence type IV pilus minor pilin ComGF [Halalkalibacter okhensis]KHF38083.1 hypothetical protein LQ50_23450 [Halalkalibacter okhensis]
MNVVSMLRNERGFSLMELLMALAIFIIIASLLPKLILIRSHGYYTNVISTQQVMTFFNQLAHEVRESKKGEVIEGTLRLTKYNEDIVDIEVLQSKQIRSRKNKEGHNLLIEQVKTFSCEVAEYLVTCEIEMLDGYRSSKMMLMQYARKGGSV